MAVKILMPALSPTMTRGKIARWNIGEGDRIRIGDVIAEIETDKAIMEFESVDEGILGKILLNDGAEVEVNTIIGWILESETDVIPDGEEPVAEQSSKSKATIENNDQPKSAKNAFSTPAARARASELGIDINKVTGSGPHGRVRDSDVVAYNSQSHPTSYREAQNPACYTSSSKPAKTTPLSAMQRVIATRMIESKTTIPHFYLEITVCIDQINELRAKMNSRIKTTLTHWFIMAAARALQAVPTVNASWSNDMIKYYTSSDISLAVSLDDGLITPIIHDASSLRIVDLVAKTNELVERARAGKLAPNEYQGGSLTLSNLGMYGIERFYPIINPPQGAILGIGASREHLCLRDGGLQVEHVIACTLSADHRAINGADAASFLQEFKKLVENPLTMMI